MTRAELCALLGTSTPGEWSAAASNALPSLLDELDEADTCIAAQKGAIKALSDAVDRLKAEIAAKDAMIAEAREALLAAERLYLDGVLGTPAEVYERTHAMRRAVLAKLGDMG